MRQALDINHSSTSLAASHMLCCRLTHREVAKKQICPVREGGCAAYCSKFHQATSERLHNSGGSRSMCVAFFSAANKSTEHRVGAYCRREEGRSVAKPHPCPILLHTIRHTAIRGCRLQLQGTTLKTCAGAWLQSTLDARAAPCVSCHCQKRCFCSSGPWWKTTSKLSFR